MSDERSSVEVELKYIRRDLDVINEKLDNGFVTKEEFAPVRNLVYGLVGLLLTGVIGSFLMVVIRL